MAFKFKPVRKDRCLSCSTLLCPPQPPPSTALRPPASRHRIPGTATASTKKYSATRRVSLRPSRLHQRPAHQGVGAKVPLGSLGIAAGRSSRLDRPGALIPEHAGTAAAARAHAATGRLKGKGLRRRGQPADVPAPARDRRRNPLPIAVWPRPATPVAIAASGPSR